MSLINKMLSDLEQRQSYFKDHDQIVLGGLAPVADTGFSSPKIPYNFLLSCFFFIALFSAAYSYLGGAGYKEPSHIDVTTQAEIVPSVVPANTDKNVAGYEQHNINLPEAQPLIIAQEPSVLKLDTSLPSQVGIDASSVGSIEKIKGITNNAGQLVGTVALINNITISLVDDVTTIQLFLDRGAEFEIYTLENPDRVVLEIENTLLQASIPVIAEHPYIKRLRFSNRTGESFKLVVDAMRSVVIENTEMVVGKGGDVLSIKLTSRQADKVDIAPTSSPDLPVGETISTNVLPADETNFGQMQVTPSTGSADISIERSVAEARQLYSDKDIKRGDEKVLGVIRQQPLHIQARLLYASTLINRGHAEAAMQLLEEGLKLDPAASEWAKPYARLLINHGQTDHAVNVLAKALPDISKDNDYYALYAALLQRASRHDEASEVYRSLLAQQSDNGLWWMGMAISLDAMKSKEDALHAYNKALEGQALNYELRQYVLQQIERLSR